MELDFSTYQKVFDRTKSVYQETRDLGIQLKFKKGIFFTMRGAIQYRSLFKKSRKYTVFVNVNKKVLLSKLDENDIAAWFAHELAHIVEYEKMSNWELCIFSLKYTFNPHFRSTVEKRINAYAANNGFANEMFTIWKKFLSLEGVMNPAYKRYIVKNYRPHWKQIRETALSLGITQEKYTSFEYTLASPTLDQL